MSGEGNYDVLDNAIGKVVAAHKKKGDLNLSPLHFSPEMERPTQGALLYPGKVLADAEGNRLFVGDTGHNRIVQTDLDGNHPEVIGDGEEGFADGPYAKARFNRPQGICVDGDTLYVADTENHAIRAVDLKSKIVSTIAGTGKQGHLQFRKRFSGKAKTASLNSPWDVIQLPGSKSIFIAMAGPHQIWRLDPEKDHIEGYAGSGIENIVDGSLTNSAFAQPSGLATDGKNLFVADSEVSASGTDCRRGTLRIRRPRRQRIVGPAPALPRRRLFGRNPIYRRYLQQQDQGMRPASKDGQIPDRDGGSRLIR